MEESLPIILFQLILRIVGAVVCSRRAEKINRNSGGWGFFGFLLPLIAIIWVYCLKPKIDFREQ